MNELKVGLLSLLAVASLVVVTVKIAGDKGGFGSFVPYRTIVKDASGIYENSTIKVAGITAGKINSIELSGSQALIKFEVSEKIKVTKYSTLRIKSVGFLGDKYIDIYLGDPNAERLEPGSLLTSETGAGFEELGKDASEVLKDVKIISRSIREALYDEKGNNLVSKLMNDISDFSKSAKEIGSSIKEIVLANEEKFQDIIDNIDRLTDQIAYETDRGAEGSMMNDLSDIKPIMANLERTSNDLKIIMADVKAGKGTVGKLLRDDEVVDQVNITLAGVNRIVNRINNFKTNLQMFSGVNDKYGGRTDFNVDLIPAPERLFRFGIVISDYGPLSETNTETQTTTSGVTVTENVRKINDSRYKFNLQIGRRYGKWGVRAGLIETTGGIGLDYYIPSWGVHFFNENFDYQEDAGPNVRLGAHVRLWNVFYAQALAEDLVSKDQNQSYTLSAGLRFNDDDLASLIGIFSGI